MNRRTIIAIIAFVVLWAPASGHSLDKSDVTKAFRGLWTYVHEGVKGEAGVLLAGVAFDSNSGLGNAHYDADVPSGGLGYGLRGGLLIGPGKIPKIGLDLELRFTHPELRRPPVSVATAWAWRVLGRWMFDPMMPALLKNRVQPFAVVGLGQEVQIAAKDHVDLTDFDASLVLGGGLDVKILHRVHARFDLRWSLSEPRPDPNEDGITFGVSNTWEAHIGVAYLIGGPPPDEDDDGVPDDGRDKCPDRPEDHDNFKDEDGCPDDDNDGDGILDALDKCPDSPEDRDNFKDKDGCPEPDNDGDGVLDLLDKCRNDPEDSDGFKDKDGCPDLDNDADGVMDTEDLCPNHPEDKDGHMSDDGCPDLDNDGDGILDKNDKCPNNAEDYDGWQDKDGCPDLDNDGDGILDKNDKCPAVPEKFNGVEDTDGCPDSNSPDVRALLSQSVSGVVFLQDKLEPVASERAMLRIFETLKTHPTLRLQLRCPVGEPAAPNVIAPRTTSRCNSVQSWLVQKGINTNRLKVMAETKPRGQAKMSILELARW